MPRRPLRRHNRMRSTTSACCCRSVGGRRRCHSWGSSIFFAGGLGQPAIVAERHKRIQRARRRRAGGARGAPLYWPRSNNQRREVAGMSVLKEFREFAVKGNVIDLAVGVIIGAAFGKIVDSLVADIIMPLVGLVFGKLDFSNLFVVLGTVPAGVANNAGRPEEGRRAGAGLRQLHHHRGQLRDPGLHHLHDGQADQPAARDAPKPRRPHRPRRRKTSCCCARSATASSAPDAPRERPRHPDRLDQAGRHRRGPCPRCRTRCRDRGWCAPAAGPASRSRPSPRPGT